MAAAIVDDLRRELLVPDPVLVEADALIRSRAGLDAARALLSSVAAGDVSVAFLTPGVLRMAAAIDQRHADLNLGLVDATVMAVAERERLPILTFDFRHFRAAPRSDGAAWPLVIDEAAFARLTAR
jgi:predicted nucleic acid-binding protein